MKDERGIDVNCFGDSLTFGYGGEGITYPGTLQKLLGNGYQVYNMGVGGETTTTIAGRQGSIPMLVKTVTIPAEVKALEVELISANGEIPKPLRQGEAGVNPCYIKGIKGNLTITQTDTTNSDAKWYFTREEKGAETFIKEPVELITAASLNRRQGVLILWTGTNDLFDIPKDRLAKKIIEQQRVMVDYMEYSEKQYIIIGLTYSTAFPFIDDVNKELKETYGKHFLNIKPYLLEEGLKAAGLVETEQDRLKKNQGNIPESLLVDDVHFNALGYTLIGEQVYKKGIELGYW
jgi:lysophospholipase L1-like esterase